MRIIQKILNKYREYRIRIVNEEIYSLEMDRNILGWNNENINDPESPVYSQKIQINQERIKRLKQKQEELERKKERLVRIVCS
jgi:hypothetical protein